MKLALNKLTLAMLIFCQMDICFADGPGSGNGEGDGAFAIQTNIEDQLLQPHEVLNQKFAQAQGRKPQLSFSRERCPDSLQKEFYECSDFVPFSIVEGDLDWSNNGLPRRRKGYHTEGLEINLAIMDNMSGSSIHTPVLAIRKLINQGPGLGRHFEMSLVFLSYRMNYPVIGKLVESQTGYKVYNSNNLIMEFRQVNRKNLVYQVYPITNDQFNNGCFSLSSNTYIEKNANSAYCAVGQFWIE